MSAPTKRAPEPSTTETNGTHDDHPGGKRAKRIPPQQLTGAEAVVRSLEELGVEVIFGIPGGAVLPVYDPLFDSQQLRHVLVRHEQGAGHAASGYAHATGRVGVMMATSGPGATNLVTPLADAQMDSIPVVAITGQVGRSLIGTDAFQEADITGMTMPITKHNFLVRAETISRGRSPRRSTSPPPADTAPFSSTFPRTCCRARAHSPGRRISTCPGTSRTPSRTAARSRRPPS